jgi:serine phosphatase RsbU (regulator of sigma subunit)
MKGVRFGEGTKRMAPGEVFFLYTDGLSEGMNRSEDAIFDASSIGQASPQ